MPVSSRALVEFVLLGPMDDRRQLQDSPILGDVWIEFATSPGRSKDLLISPYSSSHKTLGAGPLAREIADRIGTLRETPSKRRKKPTSGQRKAADNTDAETAEPPDAHALEEAHVAYLQGIVAARLFFREVLRVIVPMTHWWAVSTDHIAKYDFASLPKKLEAVLRWANAKLESEKRKAEREIAPFTALDRYLILAGLILWASQEANARSPEDLGALIKDVQDPAPISQTISQTLIKLYEDIKKDEQVWEHRKSGRAHEGTPTSGLARPEPVVYQISMNRVATPALERSVPAVKGDAARTLFTVKCGNIGWAVIDSGIDGNHPAFGPATDSSESRVMRSFDFTKIREIVSLDNLRPVGAKRRRFEERVENLREGRPITAEQAAQNLIDLAKDASNERPIHWELVEPFIEIETKTKPYSGHGTHVAGIIGASKDSMEKSGQLHGLNVADGLCPDIKLYDFRVLARSLEDTEFAIIATLQYIRYLNERHNFLTIHGVNLSISIRHDVRNYACGRTPVCEECERLVESGVVVVAAAGNRGYQNFDTAEGGYEGYAAFSITDPGNAASVITVGATHRFWPHTYGVSFFSSRGPTGDGRLKPDLVAPGERIESALPIDDSKWGQLDGTSMAVPHVSGAAAMLMARYSELVGQPRRVKRILCETATDLERERSFQGHGMLDILRAFQSI